MVDSTSQAGTGTVDYDQSKSRALVSKAIGRDFEAFGELYRIYLDRIYRYVFYHVREKMTAQDITEEVFLKAWKAIGSCKGKEQTFSSWLYRIAHNQVIDSHRSRQRRLTVEIAMENLPEVVDTKQEMDAKLDQQQLLEAITCLDEKQKQIIILKFIEGMDNNEIEQIVGKNQGYIRVLQMRALHTLRQRLVETNRK